MKHNQYTFSSKVWIYEGPAAWHFITVPQDISVDIKKMFGDRARGWGSLPVTITIGETTWKTSIFPDKKSNAYVLPVKAEVRKKEIITAGMQVNCLIEVNA